MLDAFQDTLAEQPLIALVLFALGVVAMVGGGGWLVDGSIAIARRIGVSTLMIGLTIVAMGTSAPELAFNVIAASSHHTELSFGNIIGSNIANIGLILGVTAIYRPLAVHGRVISTEIPWLIGVSLGVGVLALGTGSVSGGRGFERLDGLIMLASFFCFMLGWVRMGKRDRNDPLVKEASEEIEGDRPRSTGIAVGLILLGLTLLVAGGKMAEMGATSIATWLGLSDALVGLTIVAIATSLPELFTALMACRKGHDDLAVGNAVGSNIFNLLLVLAVTTIIAPVVIPTHGLWDLFAMILLTIALLPLARSHNRKITRLEGVLLLAAYVGYMTWSVLREM